VRLTVLGEERDRMAREGEVLGRPATVVLGDDTRSVVTRVDSPDIPFGWTLNPYRGCEHGCAYCYARPGHEYLGMSCGLDFETRIMAKAEAPELLRRWVSRPAWEGETIVMSGVTDPYQPMERALGITRGCLEVAASCGQPVSVVTKSGLVARDIDLLSRLAVMGACRVAVSVTTLDNRLAAEMEPRAAAPAARLAVVRELSRAGVPVTVLAAPMIPGLNDHELPSILGEASAAGATHAGYVLLRLPHQVKGLFLDWLSRTQPGRAAKVESLLRQARDGDLYDPSWGVRMKGRGPIAARVRSVFTVFARRHGLATSWGGLSRAGFRRPGGQGLLFGGVT
jgi:DNA repair photolyase